MLINVEEIFSRKHRGNDQLMVGGKLWTLFHFAVRQSSQVQEIFSVVAQLWQLIDFDSHRNQRLFEI